MDSFPSICERDPLFEDLDLGIVLPAIPSDQRTLYVKRILKSLTEEEVHLFKKTLACFSKNNGSIKIAQKNYLFIKHLAISIEQVPFSHWLYP